MPESGADTFWGKGFLDTALGTESPDRKKTHRGQTFGLHRLGAIFSVSIKRRRHQHIGFMQGLSKRADQ